MQSGPRGGLSFEFIPHNQDVCCGNGYDRFGPDVFSITEQAFLFIEGLIARSFPDWSINHRHWGMTWVARDTWLDILPRFQELRRDISGNARFGALVETYVLHPGLIPRKHKLHRKALLAFLDRFEDRVRRLCERHPYLLICGI